MTLYQEKIIEHKGEKKKYGKKMKMFNKIKLQHFDTFLAFQPIFQTHDYLFQHVERSC